MNNWGDEVGQEGHSRRMRRESPHQKTQEEQAIQVPEPTDAKATGREGVSHVQGAAVSPFTAGLMEGGVLIFGLD